MSVATWDRVAVVEAALDAALANLPDPERLLEPDEPVRPGSTLTAGAAMALFEDQLRSRSVDVAARELRRTDRGFYTIASAGHEQNALLGALTRPTDPAFLHYRSGGFMMARARQLAGTDPVRDALLGVVAAADDPASGGRHKVWGSRPMWVPPQTSTIASHLPKAVGMALGLGRARRLGLPSELPHDAIVMCSFGDASVNHATALAGINTARYARRIGLPAPILFVCEDNERGISVDTPAGWVEDLYGSARHLEYVEVDAEVDEAWDLVTAAVMRCRTGRAPVFVHLRCVRLWGHAGSDPELTYRTLSQVEADEARDPLLRNARRLVELGVARPATLTRLVGEVRRHACQTADEVAGRPRLASRAAVMAPLAAWDGAAVLRSATRAASTDERRRAFGAELPEERRLPNARTLAAHINAALADELARRRELVVFGEDVGRKGGVYNVTAGLQRTFGGGRVFDTLLDETSILGLAQGFALAGLLPIPEIQYLAYLHNALDQIRGEAASLSFFSNGRFRNPMVVRVASFGYQRGFGGHFHNDNSIGALRDIPGLLLAAPSRGHDAARLLRGCIAAAEACGRVACFLEPIALYHEKDLHQPGDGAWLSDYPPAGSALLPGEVGRYGPRQAGLLIVSYANGLRLSLQAARVLEREHGIAVRVVDLRWLSPLPFDAVRHEASACGRVLVVDECRATGGGIADAVVADLAEHRFAGPMASLRSADSYVPLGPAAETVLLSRDEIVAAARLLAA